ncbi:hypothetical protein LAC81_07185 [Ensifer adhaerens]|uniref:hypothetical protein n=1 Tax=Ensifer adhaerens TaxID=106592 RepID=UPI001CBDE72D|nr:hypothetical protein [Ensifer adhaerens]MBZ7921561.1 hypothetical protein [Ensifer adhaerens]UAX93985.1 hypothetical protein LAC78_07180 [Ensifer adhaerens]UAY01620.1 hypothetical protein LAC80_07185 [Ensifer adhaerens]UAY09003.1 hypothetical protein LAC81_07185 [Ensifer adhaerens]
MANDLRAGFTGKPTEPPTGARKVARKAAAAVSREANAVTVGAADHPYTASGLTLAVGFVAFAIGYAIGRSKIDSGRSYWR